ncbi:MAG: ABC transporter ATP-binding protein [Zetaproteobacteria bacterium]|nr:ABC transporter ATP-binding protein [Pseudobdellovibrionaceae bacterium]
MIVTQDVSLNYGSRKLFEEVNIKFVPGNCYGVIGANGAGKSTFLKILSGELQTSKGEVHIDNSINLSVLKQDHFEFNEENVLETVIMGHRRLMEVRKAKDELYSKGELSEEEGIKAAELEMEFANLNGWEAEAEAATLLNGLGLGEQELSKTVRELKDSQKVKVLLAQALFGQPDVLLLDEPTNHLDFQSIRWLENFLLDFDNTVIVVSHDRHFLNKVCTHMVDIDYGKVNVSVGNYDFWKESSTLARNLLANENKKNEQKAKELESFIRRFSANAAKSKQATSRKKQLEKLTLEDIPQSTRKYPHIVFEPERESRDILLEVSNLSKQINGETILNDLSFEIQKGERVLFLSENELAQSVLFDILMKKFETDQGSFRWGVTTSQSYLPVDSSSYFEEKKISLIDWLRQYSNDQSENFIRSFLGKMLFSGEETLKHANVLSGGEKVRCMLSKIMLEKTNVLLLDNPTNHLDLESITSLNRNLTKFPGTLLFSTHDQEFASSLATRIIEITADGIIDHQMSYKDYIKMKDEEKL